MVKLGYAHELWQLNAAGSLDALPPEDLAIASAALADSLIEKYEVPSLHPGLAKEDGGTPGASPQQIAFWEAWNARFTTGKRIFACAGANQCLGPETMVMGVPISEVKVRHTVTAFDGKSATFVIAGKPFVKGADEVYRFTLSNGEWFDCSAAHLLLTPLGWRHAGEFLPRFGVCHPRSNVGFDLSVHSEDDSRCSQKVQDSRCGCQTSRHSCDERPLIASSSVSGVSPSRLDAPAHSGGLALMRLDDSACRAEHSRFCQWCGLPSSPDEVGRFEGRFSASSRQTFDTISRRFDEQRHRFFRPVHGSCLASRSIHEVDPELAWSLIAPVANGYSTVTVSAIESRGVQPIYDFTVPRLHNYIAAGVVHHNSSKTTTVAGAFCKHIRDEAADGSIFWIVAQSFPTLRDIPLRTVWELLPRSMFGDRWSFDPACHSIPTIVLDLPHGRGKVELWARSEDMSLDKFESARLNGVWWTECGDERIFHALQPRLLKHRGFMLMDYVSREAWHRDLSERALIPESIIHHQRFAVQNNAHNLPAGAIKDMKPVSLGGRGTMSEQEWRVRGLGLDGNAEGAVYPQFDPAVHCVKPFKVPDRWPLYIGADWGFRNPHAFLLATVAPNEAKFVVAEEYGPQATPFEVCQRMWSLVGSFRPMDCGQWETPAMMFAALRAELNTVNREDRPVRDWIRDQWTKVLASACVIDASVYDRDQADGTALADEFARIGFPTQPSIKHNKDGSVEMVRRAFEQRRLFFFDTCRMTRRDHATWRYKEKADGTLPSQDRYSDKDDHAVDAVQYLLRANPCYNPAKSEVVS